MLYSDHLIDQISTFFTIVNIFYYRKKGEGGGQKVMIGIIISENVDNYGRPLSYLINTSKNEKILRPAFFPQNPEVDFHFPSPETAYPFRR